MNWCHQSCAAALFLALAASFGPAASAHAQHVDAHRGGIHGAVLDAASGLPVAGAAVVLQPEVVGAFPAGPATGSAFTASSRSVVTDSDGAYRFDNLPSGVYRVYVSRLGYRPYSVTVELRGAASSAVGVALAAEPIPLQPVRSRGHARGPFETASAFAAGVDHARLFAADLRRLKFLTTDSRELTHVDVVEAVTLGEPDVMRALQRLPGVTTRSDYTAELWTRGAPWSHTRVFFDGVPVFNPLHALGVLSGIGSNAIGAVWFHPGVRSAGMAEGAAGIVDLQSRRASGGGEVNVHADVSLVSAALALDQRVLDGRAGWMLSGRQTWFDWMTRLGRHASSRDDVAFPYGFVEVAGSADVFLGEAGGIEASWLWERDHVTSLRTAEPYPSLRAEWGNVVGRVSHTARVGRINVRHTAALSWHDGAVAPEPGVRAIPISTLRRDGDIGVGWQGVTGTLWPEPASLAGPSWSAGYGYEQQEVNYYGPQVLPVPRFTTRPGAEDNARVSWRGTLPLASVWGERLWSAGERVGVRAGLRAELSEPPLDEARLRWSPRLSVRFAPIPEVALSAGAGRVFQYTQAIAPGGLYLASLSSTDVWVLAGPETPALRADIATAGLEAWLAPGRAVAINGFARRSTGVAASDPRPGRVYDRSAWVFATNAARGLEVSVRQLTGRVTGSAAYSLSRSDNTAVGLRYPAASDRRHVLSATTMVRATSSLRAGAGFTAAAGVPFTRVVDSVDECALEPGCDPQQLPWLSVPNAARAPAFASLDLFIDWSRRVRGFDIGAYAQLRNALGRDNATIYTADPAGCLPAGCEGDLRSEFERGVPRMPVVGVRVRR
jgi:hypothetical protein